MNTFAFTLRNSIIVVLLTIATVFYQTDASQKYPFKADFNLRSASFVLDSRPGIEIDLINMGIVPYDSLQIRLFFNETQAQMSLSGNQDDTIIQFCGKLGSATLYQADGGKVDHNLDSLLQQNFLKADPVKILDIFDSANGKHGWYFPINLDNISIPAGGGKLKLRVLWENRFSSDTLNLAPRHIPGAGDWSWDSKLQSNGFPIDFSGISKLNIDSINSKINYLPMNPYIAIYRKGELLWGLPPDWKKHYGNSFDTIPRPPRQRMPYDPIAVPFDEYADQLQRDSVNCRISRVRVNQAGYRPADKKYFYYIGNSATTFSVISAGNGTVVSNGMLTSTGNTTSGQMIIVGNYHAIDVAGGKRRYELESPVVSGMVFEGVIPELPDGKYRVVVNSDTSAPFLISKDIYNMVKDALLKFFGANRCGDSKSWLHKPCHLDDPVTGGWHDCGDHLKEGATQSYTAAVLGLAAAVFQDRDQDVYDADQSITKVTDGIPDILYEAKHGADFILQSFHKAGEEVADMITSIGNLSDHSYWGLPEMQYLQSSDRGGSPRDARKEVTSDYLGNYAANLAFVSKLFSSIEPTYAAKCLGAAEKIYWFTRDRRDITSTSAYNGSTTVSDNLAFASLGLLWATGERKYLDDLCFDTTIGRDASRKYKSLFEGGWFTEYGSVFSHSLANTNWASSHTHVLWGFFRLVLEDEALCLRLGLTETQRLGLMEKTVYNLITNLASVGEGTKILQMPDADSWIPTNVKYDLPWYSMHTMMEWVWNHYQAGNIADMYYSYDIASRVQGLTLPYTPSSTDWKGDSLKVMLVRMLDYILGVNPWDVSMIGGIGFKNLNHPHHRASNPEIRNIQVEYEYRTLVGALIGGYPPTTSIYAEHVDHYVHSEVGIESNATLLIPVLGLSSTDRAVRSRFSNLKPGIKNPQLRIIPRRQGTFLITSDKPFSSIEVFSLSGRLIARSRFAEARNTFVLGEKGKMIGRSNCLVFRIIFSNGGFLSRKVTVAN